jgi:hypothetical protein
MINHKEQNKYQLNTSVVVFNCYKLENVHDKDNSQFMMAVPIVSYQMKSELEDKL